MLAKTLWLLTRRTAQSYSSHGCSQLAAAISYYVLFSVVPLVIVATSVFGMVIRNSDLRQRVIDRVVDATPLEEQQGHDLVENTVRGVSRASIGLSLVGLAGMAWSASAMVAAARRALNVVWEVRMSRPVVQAKLIDFALLLSIGLLLVASVAGTTALHIFRQISIDRLGPLSGDSFFVWTALGLVVPALLALGVFLLLYRYLPAVDVTFRDLWPGALLAALLFEVLQNSFAFYVAHFNNYNLVYGSLGAVLLFLLWAYLATNIMLFGAEFAVQYGRLRRGEYEGPPTAGPAGSPLVAMSRFVRGLFVRAPRGGRSEPNRGEASRRETD